MRIRSALTYANVVSTLCLFLVLGGGAFAARQFVGSGDIKPGAVRSSHVENGTLRINDLSIPLQASLQPLQPQPIREGEYRGFTASGFSVFFVIIGEGDGQKVDGGVFSEAGIECGEGPVRSGAFLVSCTTPGGPGSMTGRGTSGNSVVGNVTETMGGIDDETYKVSEIYAASLTPP